MALLWILLGAALVVATAIFHSLNPMALDLNLFGYPVFGAPLWAVVVVPAIVGLAVGILMDVPDRVRSAWQARRSTKALRERDKTIAQLQQRVAELEGKLTAPPVIIEETRRLPATPAAPTVTEVTETRTELPRAA